MHKVYLLLRNNKQTGPHTLEELVQLAPKPNDLIWIEGRSAGWSYPSEIDALKPYVSGTPNASAATRNEVAERPAAPAANKATLPTSNKEVPKKVFVSLPVNGARPAVASSAPVPEPEKSLESRAEALRQRAQAYAPIAKEEAEAAPLETKYARTLNDVEEDFTSWMVQKKTKRKTYSGRSIAIGVVGMALVGVGYMLFKNTPVEGTEAAAPATVQQPVTAPASETATPIYAEEVPEEKGNSTANTTSLAQKENKNLPVTPQKGTAAAPTNQKKEIAAADTGPAPEKAAPPSSTTQGTHQPPQKEESETAAANEKKTIGQKIDGFFEKFKGKKKEEATDETATTTTPADGGERKATRRGAEEVPATPEVLNLATQVEVTSSQPSQNWMMGIKDVKLTLRNRSEATVKDAAVEVLYYNEQKELLEKKVVRFSNVPPKKSKTIPAPDHRLADHTDYRLLSASGF